jgi:hypothetical protein
MNKFTKKMTNKETMESLKMDKYIISYEYIEKLKQDINDVKKQLQLLPKLDESNQRDVIEFSDILAKPSDVIIG